MPLIIWPVPSLLTVTGSGQRATPLPTSVQVNITVTLLLLHPAAFGGGFTPTSTSGGVLSMFSVTEAVD